MPNSIINSDDGVVSGQSGLKTSGGDNGILQIQSNGATVFDTYPTQVVARQTFYAIDDGVPLLVRATDSNTYKIGMEDTSGGTQRGFIGANSTNALMVANGSTTNVLNVTSAGVLQANSGFGSVANGYLCRAWAAWTATTIPASLLASANVSSLADNGVGNFTVNFTNNMTNANYAAVGSALLSPSNANVATQAASAGAVNVFTTANNASIDVGYNAVAVFR